MNDRIRAALLCTPNTYLASCLSQRAGTSPERLGSFYPDLSPPEVFEALQAASWEAYDHPEVRSPAVAFKAAMPGVFGMVRLDALPHDTQLRLVDPKGTGLCDATVVGGVDVALLAVEHTTMLLGPGDNGEVVWTFFPGDPIWPSTVTAEPGKVISWAEAKALGFEWVKAG